MLQPFRRVDLAHGPDLAAAVRLDEYWPEPVDHRALHVRWTGRTGMRHILQARDVVPIAHGFGQGQQALEVRGHHQRGGDPMRLDQLQGPLRIETAEDHHRLAGEQMANRRQRSVVLQGPDHQMGARRVSRSACDCRREVGGVRRGRGQPVHLGSASTPGCARCVDQRGPGGSLIGSSCCARGGGRVQKVSPGDNAVTGGCIVCDHGAQVRLAGGFGRRLQAERSGDHRDGSGVDQLVGHLTRLELAGYRHRPYAAADGCGVREQGFHVVLADHPNALVRIAGHTDEPLAEGLEDAQNLVPGRDGAVVHQGCAGGIGHRPIADSVEHRLSPSNTSV